MATSQKAGRLYGGKTAEERRAERRDRLLDVALDLFGTIGATATTIEMLCAAAQLNPRYFYEEFQTREALLMAVYDRHVNAVIAAVGEALQSAPPEPRAQLEAGLRAFVRGSVLDERAARVNYIEMVGGGPVLQRRRQEVLRAYAETIVGQMAALDAPVGHDAQQRRLDAVALVGATDGLIIDWLSDPARGDVDRIITTLLDIFSPAPASG